MNILRRCLTIILSMIFISCVSSILAIAQDGAPVLVAQIVGNLNSKSAKIGDPVMATTKKTSNLKDGRALPKGTKLIGRVVAVQSRQAGSGTSSLAIKFNQVEVKDGPSLPVEGQIIAIGFVSQWQNSVDEDSVMRRGASVPAMLVDPHPAPATNSGAYPTAADTLRGVYLDHHLDNSGAPEFRGINREIKLDSQVLINVALM